jgi:hypothetical protein
VWIARFGFTLTDLEIDLLFGGTLRETDPSAKDRLDGAGRVKESFRSPWVTRFIEAARIAGLPDELLKAAGGNESWYSELILRCSTYTTEHSLEAMRDDIETLELGLRSLGVEPTDQLVPYRMLGLLELQRRATRRVLFAV